MSVNWNARHIKVEKKYKFVHPYRDPAIIAGQGTIGLEILEDLPDVDTIIVPVGGGGLISGIATVVKSLKPDCKVFGVVAAEAPAMRDYFKTKKLPSGHNRIFTIADGIAVKNPSPEIYENFISKLVDDFAAVTDDEIAEAMVLLIEKAKTVVEGSGAVGLAAALAGALPLGKKTCVSLSGGNVDLNIMSKVIDRGLTRHGRLVELSVIVADLPGSLSRLTQILANQRANILQVNHDRVAKGLRLRETRIDFILETNSEEHIAEIKKALVESGARIL